MNRQALLQRQRDLLARSTHLRDRLSDQTQIFKKPLALADQTSTVAQWIYGNAKRFLSGTVPKVALGSLLLSAILKPGNTLAWGRRALAAWKVIQKMRQWAKK